MFQKATKSNLVWFLIAANFICELNSFVWTRWKCCEWLMVIKLWPKKPFTSGTRSSKRAENALKTNRALDDRQRLPKRAATKNSNIWFLKIVAIFIVPLLPFSPDIAPCDFWLFKKKSKGRYKDTIWVDKGAYHPVTPLIQQNHYLHNVGHRILWNNFMIHIGAIAPFLVGVVQKKH